MERLIEKIKSTHPGLAKRYNKGSRQAAIRLFCLECMGGHSSEVKSCTATSCPLFKYRLGIKIK